MLIYKMCRSLASRSSQRFFSEKRFFAKFVKCLNKFFPLLLNSRLLHIFEISAKFRFFWYPLQNILKNFFFNSYKGRCYFFLSIKGQITWSYDFKAKLKTHIEFIKKFQNHWTLLGRISIICGRISVVVSILTSTLPILTPVHSRGQKRSHPTTWYAQDFICTLYMLFL